MRNPRTYILHEGQRVYTDGAEIRYEFSCDHCAKEVPESGMYTLNGQLGHSGNVNFGASPGESAHLHEACVIPHVAARLAKVKLHAVPR